ncbi:beta-ketoacyl [acyl carrier protein] synthase domain-containing protein [Aspergillus alliaceus]|uniref:beta-ketoacyl [acyl carrier protein] synthase domain-containing protein n=1 Tax=Petromyces alliaceus TaxID=209559 RepID=UPI0012A545E2|nr:thiolase-like protein [Aspergillus alliaceus]KAB8231310.1 thiolase-like protein [Aspergillus alliaceus]
MYGLMHISFLGFVLALATTGAAKMTTVGFETTEGSFGESVPLNECHNVQVEDTIAVYVSQYCRVFIGQECTGRQILLNPGEHPSKWPIPMINSVVGFFLLSRSAVAEAGDEVPRPTRVPGAGGVNATSNYVTSQDLMAANFLSASHGPCRPFDGPKDGFSRGGRGFVLLKRLSDAVADRDNILGVNSGCATNQNSNTSTITVPDSQSQVDVYQRELQAAGLNPPDVSFVKAHGTGRAHGDPIKCIRQVFGGRDRGTLLCMGSLKAIIGHTGAASGVAIILKVLLMLKHREIPPQANFAPLNPTIPSLNNDRIVISTDPGGGNRGFVLPALTAMAPQGIIPPWWYASLQSQSRRSILISRNNLFASERFAERFSIC